ncbi:MAG: hypothetical protein EU518_00490 [Promethearchaeota archaeon]|nr:MAG: hypothetical protein EU518_00490 [Candidatus Lokiarchaeota archaeon]
MDNNRNTSTNSEEIIFYLDIITDFIKKKTLLKAIDSFIEEKSELNKKVTYSLVLFQQGKDLFTLYDKNAENLINTINELWDEKDEEQSYFENGLYEILAHIFKRSRKESKIYQVIIFSDSVSNLSDEYHTALYNLILKAKNFSTKINIIRLGEEKFYEDDVKLKVITSETFGATLYCNDRKNLNTYLNSLVKAQENVNILETEVNRILEEDYTFYEKLATDLISISPEDETICVICEEEICPICETYSDEVHKCYNCNAPFHSCCAAEYSITNKIGFPNIFRCPRCGALLKLDKDFVETIIKEMAKETQEEKEEPERYRIPEEYIPEEDFIEDQHEMKSQKFTPLKKKVKVGGFFGTEIDISTLNSSSIQENATEMIQNKDQEEISISSLKPPRSKISLKLCPICGATVKESLYCPVCGSKIDK